MKTFRFLEFDIYRNSKEFHNKILRIGRSLRDKREFYLADQLLRCSLSVSLNIAEGSARQSDKDFGRFLRISLGSLNEVVACLDILSSQGFVLKSDFECLIDEAEVISKQIGSFLKRLVKATS